MRLLSKNEIVVGKAAEKRMEIDEGLKLARKVDALRETALKEEASLNKFRDGSVSNVKEEIALLIDKKAKLEDEIKRLLAERVELLKPLDREWDKLNAKIKEVEDTKTMLAKKQAELDHESTLRWQLSNKIALEKERVDDERSRSKEILKDADRAKTEAEGILREVKLGAEAFDKYVSTANAQLVTRETNIAARERDASNKEEFLRKKEVDLAQLERSLKDRYDTLQRTINRTKK